MKSPDVLIIGAGPSGTLAASILLKEGYNVTILEKTTFPRFVIGESLLPRCVDLLEDVGLLETIAKQNFQIKKGARFNQNELTCNFNFEEQFTKGKTYAWQVLRADYDKALADEVEKRGANILYNATVTNVNFLEEKVITEYKINNQTHITESKYIIDASGYGRVLPNLLGLDLPSTQKQRNAFFTHVKTNHQRQDEESKVIQIEVIDDNNWFWIIPLANRITSIGFVGDVTIDEHYDLTQQFKKLIKANENIAGKFANAEYLFTPKYIKGYSKAVSKFYGDKFVLTGNSTEFLDPVFSSGVTLAMESGVLAGKLVSKALKQQNVDWDKEYVEVIQSGVEVFRSYINAWYNGDLQTIFFAPHIDENIKKQICSVLAGYVWDTSNPYVTKHKKALKTLVKVIEMNNL